MKTDKNIAISDIFKQSYLFKIKCIYLAKVCGGFEAAKDAIKNAIFDEIEGAVEEDHQDTCSLFWKGSQNIDSRTGKTGWIPYINNGFYPYQSPKDSFYFLDGGIAIDTVYSINGGDKFNIPDIKASLSYIFKPWCVSSGNSKFESAAGLSGALHNIEKKVFDYRSKKNYNNSFFDTLNDTLGFIDFLYLSNFNKKACERIHVFNALNLIKEDIELKEKRDFERNTLLLNELAKVKTNINEKIGGLTGVYFDKLNIFVELKKIDKLITETAIDTSGLSMIGAILKIGIQVFNIQIFNSTEGNGPTDNDMTLERNIYDYYSACENLDKDKNLELYKKLISLNKETDKFTSFLLGVLEKYKTRIAVELM